MCAAVDARRQLSASCPISCDSGDVATRRLFPSNGRPETMAHAYLGTLDLIGTTVHANKGRVVRIIRHEERISGAHGRRLMRRRLGSSCF